MDDELLRLLKKRKEQVKAKGTTKKKNETGLAVLAQAPTAATTTVVSSTPAATPSSLIKGTSSSSASSSLSTVQRELGSISKTESPIPSAATTSGMSRLVPFPLKSVKTSSDQLSTFLEGRQVVKISDLGKFVSGANHSGDWALMGVLAQKSESKRTSNGKYLLIAICDEGNLRTMPVHPSVEGGGGGSGGEYSVWTLSDLDDHSVQVFLFGGSSGRVVNVAVGMVLCLLSPKVLERRSNSNAALPLSLSQSYQVIEIGFASDFATCGMTDTNGLTCGKAFNLTKGRFCSQHRQTAPADTGTSRLLAALRAPSIPQARVAKAIPPVVASQRPPLSSTIISKKTKIEALVKKSLPHRAYRWQVPNLSLRSAVSHQHQHGFTSSRNLRIESSNPKATEVNEKDLKEEGLCQGEDANQKKDGVVRVPGPSKLFSRGRDAMALIHYRESLESSRENRKRQIRETRTRQEQQKMMQAVQALQSANRGSHRGAFTFKPKPSSIASAATVDCTSHMKQSTIGDAEAQALMIKKSRHQAEAKNELVDHLNTIFDSLAEKENEAERFQSLSSIEVIAFHCVQCDCFHERWPRLCAQRHHEIKKAKTIKRFFVCINTGCGQSVGVLGPKPPQEFCSRCGKKDWRLKNTASSRMAGTKYNSSNLISAISEWNRNTDVSDLYPD